MKSFTINGAKIVVFEYDEHKEKLIFYDAFFRSVCEIEFSKEEYKKIENREDIFEIIANKFSD